VIELTDPKKSADDNCLLAEGKSRGEAWHGAETANRREDSLIDDPALHNRQSSGCLTRLPGIRRAALAERTGRILQKSRVNPIGGKAVQRCLSTRSRLPLSSRVK